MMSLFHSILSDIKKYWWVVLLVLPFFLLRFFGQENCLFNLLFHIHCPACGLSRAYISLFQGDIVGAFSYHPLFFIIPLMILFFFLRNVEKLKFLYQKNIIWWSFLSIWICAYIVRLF